MKFLVVFLFFTHFGICYSQDIKVYFNQSVDHTASVFVDAQTSSHLNDTLCMLIDMAMTTLDIAVWDNGSDQIVNCINAAYDRGVQVRYITSSNALNAALSNLNSNIPVLERNAGVTSNVMHNKFIIVDQTYLLTGSMNFNDGAMFDDYNNVVLIHDPSMCLNYTLEFEEMWGSTGANYSATNSKFGPDKTDNTIHSITIGGVVVESYFSPTDQTTAHIIEEIDAADYTLDIAMFTFINNDISDAVIAAHNRGVEVRCIIENENYIGSEFNNLVAAGIQTLSHDGVPFDFHHKYCIIDAKYTGSNPTVVTGSHNWTNSAEEEYDENTLIIHDPYVAWQYLEEFTERWSDLGGTLANTNFTNDGVSIFPNPSNGIITVNGLEGTLADVKLFSITGSIVPLKSTTIPNSFIVTECAAGIYYLQIQNENGIESFKIMIE